MSAETTVMLAGARARGMADAFSLLGLPAVFLGPDGKVLHVGAEAAPMFGPSLAIDQRRIVLGDDSGNDLQAAIASALSDGRARQVGLGRETNLVAHVIPVPPSHGQLLSAVVLLLDRADAVAPAVAAAAIGRLEEAESRTFLSH